MAMGLATQTGAEGVTDVVIDVVVDAKAHSSESTISCNGFVEIILMYCHGNKQTQRQD